jgi:hypothetical protein
MDDFHAASISKRGTVREAGLCADCAHARTIESDRGSKFLQCQLSFTDSRFPKYPRLPVVGCSGYQKPGAS